MQGSAESSRCHGKPIALLLGIIVAIYGSADAGAQTSGPVAAATNEERLARASQEERALARKEAARVAHLRDEPSKTELRSPVMVGFGTGILISGVVSGAALLGVFATTENDPNDWGFHRFGLFLGGLGSLLVGVGVGASLVFVGAEQVPAAPGDAPRRSSVGVPRIDVGAGTITSTWTF